MQHPTVTIQPTVHLLMQAEARKWAEKREAHAQDSQQAACHKAELEEAAEQASIELARLKADIAQAKKQLLALER